MNVYRRSEPLWHVSDGEYRVGDPIGPHAESSPHWTRSRANADLARVEDALERNRPASEVTRRTCVFATDSAPMVMSFVRQRPIAKIYRVEVPSDVPCSGRFDMRLVGASHDIELAAQSYWSGKTNGRTAPYAEVLATSLIVVSSLPIHFIDSIRQFPAWRDLTLEELVNASPPTA